jgi:predicted ATPase
MTRLGRIGDRLAGLLPVRPAGAEPVQEVAVYLRTRRALVVLDNCEHVIDDAGRLAEALLTDCPGLRVLATSREPLGVPGERVRSLAGLAVPGAGATPDEIAASEAVRLLADRAGGARPGLRLTGAALTTAGRLCRMLSGLPLAIELAAAQPRVMPLTELTHRLHQDLDAGLDAGLDSGLDSGLSMADRRSRTAPERHRTMRAAIDGSYRLLDPPERLVFRRLSVFAGGCDPAGAESFGATPDLLARRVDRSMLAVEWWPDGVR